jgi:hypothetical protein
MEIEEALRFLEGKGFAVKPLWTFHEGREAARDRGALSDEDRAFVCPSTPPRIADHTLGGLLPVTLRAENAWPGYHYTLTPGQRRWFREVMGLTPSETVTIDWVEKFPGTMHPARIKITSDQHFTPDRRHLLVTATVKAARFFRESAQLDMQIAEEKAKSTTANAKARRGGRAPKKISTAEELMAELEKEING